jgi:hypothetical protein
VGPDQETLEDPDLRKTTETRSEDGAEVEEDEISETGIPEIEIHVIETENETLVTGIENDDLNTETEVLLEEKEIEGTSEEGQLTEEETEEDESLQSIIRLKVYTACKYIAVLL